MTSGNKMSKLLTALLMGAAVFTMAACEQKSSEQTSEAPAPVENKVEDMMDSAAEEMSAAGDAMSEAMEEAGSAVEETAAAAEETMGEASEKVEEMTEKASEKAEEMAEEAESAAKETMEKASEKVEEVTEEEKPEETSSSDAGFDQEAALALANSSGCMACHKVDVKVMGPAFKEIAAKYAGQADAKETLIASISNGSSGKWGSMAMPANSPRVSDADIEKLAKLVLSYQ